MVRSKTFAFKLLGFHKNYNDTSLFNGTRLTQIKEIFSDFDRFAIMHRKGLLLCIFSSL
jgi:hypothetical protein